MNEEKLNTLGEPAVNQTLDIHKGVIDLASLFQNMDRKLAKMVVTKIEIKEGNKDG